MDGNGLILSLMMTFSGLTWLLMLAGVGSLQSQCRDAPSDLVGSSSACHSTYRYQWWLVVFDAAILIGIVIAGIMATIQKYRITICAMLAVVTALLMDNANAFLQLHDETYGMLADRAALFSSGCLLAAAVHLLLIIGFGQSIAPAAADAASQPNGRAPKAYEHQMAAQYPSYPSATTAAPPV